MQIYNGSLLFSASDLVNFLECPHLTALELQNLETPLPKAEDAEQSKLFQEKGYAHEAAYLESLRQGGVDVAELQGSDAPIEDGFAATRNALVAGREVVFQGCLLSPPFVGHPDFMRRVPLPSALGDFSYEVLDAKLARSPKAKFVIQLCLYSELLAELQGVSPRQAHLVLGDRSERSFVLAGYLRYFRKVRARFLDFVTAGLNDSYPERCDHCGHCHWRELCAARWRQDDHLNRVANITRVQIRKLHTAGVRTLADLACLDERARVPRMQDHTLDRLRSQAALQFAKSETGEDRFELLTGDSSGTRGFHRLPAPDKGDVFFDMEGDPLEDGGLEYLFGVYYHEQGEPRLQPFWAHDRKQERCAFENFMAFIMQRLRRHPGMHVYHYGHYEATTLKRLMSLHGTREAEVDQLLRTERLVDLYRVVREALRVSEPRYSIKNLETFYMARRTGEVTDAGASLVYYERWKQTGAPELLAQIRDYNADDCRSTRLLRDWLLSLRPAKMPWYVQSKRDDAEDAVNRIHEIETRLAEYRERLLGRLPEDRNRWGAEAHLRELVYQLLDFHRREAKQAWWAMFARREMTEEELIEDPECIGALEAIPGVEPEPVKQSLIYRYRYPEQEHKRKPDDKCLRADTLERAGTLLEIDDEQRTVRIKLARRDGELPARFSLIPAGPIKTDVLTEALFRFADSLLAGNRRYPALEALLRRERPAIEGLASGRPIVPDPVNLMDQTIGAVCRLRNSHLFIQGPPGAGKTYTGSHVIAALLKKGFRVGVSSNSHKAINNVLHAVEQRADEQGFRFNGVKKSTKADSFLNGRLIEDETDRSAVIGSGADLIAGTAWLFAHADMDQTLDYLFVDEAGQVALGNLIAMGTCAKNLVLLGDQMQLQQPIQGVHPGHSGESALDYLLQGEATIAADRGVFLGITWRMHEDVCRFISDAVYEGRLKPEPANRNQRLLLKPDAHPELRPTGVRFVAARHDGCSQRSEVEAEIVRDLYASLLQQSYRDREGNEYPMAPDNILVVAAYNMQVNLLRRHLPEGARVGTIDKFQGQQAEAVIVSLATSSGDYLPRHMAFLYSKNRLNVAISRARCLALVVASPELMTIRCKSVEQIELVNTLCWVEEYAAGII